MNNKKKITNDEIDLIEFFKIIYKQKKKIIIVTALVAIISFTYSVLRTPPDTEALLEIREISTSSEIRYNAFNEYVYNIGNIGADSQYQQGGLIYLDENQSTNNDKHKNDFIFYYLGLEAFANQSHLINSNNLLVSFIKELNKVSLIENVVKKYDLLAKTNNGNQQLESTFKETLLTFKIIDAEIKDDVANLRISFQDKNTSNIKILLSYIEKYINEKIRTNILINFQTMISTQKKIDQFKIEDLQMRINKLKEIDERETEKLDYKKQIIEQSMLIKEIEKSFLETPITDQNNFYAAQIINSTLPDIYNSKIDLKNVWLSIILSLIVMTTYVLILNTIKKHR